MRAAFEEVMEIRGEGLPGDGEVEITGADPVFSTRFKIGTSDLCYIAFLGGSKAEVDFLPMMVKRITISCRTCKTRKS